MKWAMTFFQLIAILITIAALFSYINHKFIKLPTTIGLMVISLVLSLVLVGIGNFYPQGTEIATTILNQIDFDQALLNGMLSFLLFAGALHVNLNDLAQNKWIIGILATFGVILSTFVIGTSFHYMLGFFGLQISFIYCLLFGALISPTDPIAVMGILKTLGAPKSLETKIAGESLFNDGIGVVVFLVILSLATGAQEFSVSNVFHLLLLEAGGGLVLGLALGWLTYKLLKTVDNYQVEILLTLALTCGGYALAMSLHTSGPIAIVVAGLLIGNHGRRLAMSEKTREHIDTFWELIDEILNAVLFVLIGLEVLVVSFASSYIVAGLIMIPVVLMARFFAISLPIFSLKKFRAFTPGAIPILTWAGLRGGISIALALSLPNGVERDLILTITYIIVIFSIGVQGLTVKNVVNYYLKKVN